MTATPVHQAPPLSDYMYRKLCAVPGLHPEEVWVWSRDALAAGIPNRYVDLKFCLLWWERQFRGGATFDYAIPGYLAFFYPERNSQ